MAATADELYREYGAINELLTEEDYGQRVAWNATPWRTRAKAITRAGRIESQMR